MIVHWPGQVPAGQVSDAIWSFGTCSRRWRRLPARQSRTVSTVTPTLAALKGGEAPQHDYLYWDYGHARGEYRQAVRVSDWKAVRNGVDRPIELYDLRNAIPERRETSPPNTRRSSHAWNKSSPPPPRRIPTIPSPRQNRRGQKPDETHPSAALPGRSPLHAAPPPAVVYRSRTSSSSLPTTSATEISAATAARRKLRTSTAWRRRACASPTSTATAASVRRRVRH